MPVSYKTRKADTHYVKAVKTKKGGTRYYIVKNSQNPDELINEIPPGFEFYEIPFDAQVTFRKIVKTNITDEEFSILDSVIKSHKTVEHYVIEKEKDALLVYISDYDEDLRLMLGEKQFRQIQKYDEKLRFEKNKNDEFYAQRFCFISKYYGWITMETSDDLRYLAEKYCYHIDKETLLDFWIEGEEEPEMILVGEYSGIPLYGYK